MGERSPQVKRDAAPVVASGGEHADRDQVVDLGGSPSRAPPGATAVDPTTARPGRPWPRLAHPTKPPEPRADTGACHLDRRVRPDQGAAYTVRVGRFLALVRGLRIWQGDGMGRAGNRWPMIPVRTATLRRFGVRLEHPAVVSRRRAANDRNPRHRPDPPQVLRRTTLPQLKAVVTRVAASLATAVVAPAALFAVTLMIFDTYAAVNVALAWIVGAMWRRGTRRPLSGAARPDPGDHDHQNGVHTHHR